MPTKIDQLAPEDENDLCWLISDITRLMVTEFNKRMREQGIQLSRAQGRIIARLLRKDGQTQTELADSMGMEKAPLGIVIDKLETAGFVERLADPSDRRIRRVHATDKVKKITPKVEQISSQLQDEMFSGLSNMRRLQLSQSLGHLKQNLLDCKISNSQ